MRLWDAEPEVYALRQLPWQLFVTLTFPARVPTELRKHTIVLAWLRDVVRTEAGLHFNRLLWVSRFEIGRGGQGHFHLIIARLSAHAIKAQSREAFAAMWAARTRGRAEVAAYDPTRDGVGYMLKNELGVAAPRRTKHLRRGSAQSCEPTLSKSILTLRRFRR